MVVVVVVVVVVNTCDQTEREQEWLMSGNRWLRFLGDISYGLRSEIPLCCVLEFSLRSLINPQTLYGMKNCWYGCEFVHCVLHRRRVHPWPDVLLGAWLRHPDPVPYELLDEDYRALLDKEEAGK